VLKNKIVVLVILLLLVACVISWVASERNKESFDSGERTGFIKAQDSLQSIISIKNKQLRQKINKIASDSIKIAETKERADSSIKSNLIKYENILKKRSQASSYNPDKYDSILYVILSKPDPFDEIREH